MTEEKEEAKKTEDIILRGTDSQKKGDHSLHTFGTVVSFKDGKAVVSSDLADKLRKQGFIE